MFRLGTSKISQKKYLHSIFITLVYYLVLIVKIQDFNFSPVVIRENVVTNILPEF